jgi:hypothetical protein
VFLAAQYALSLPFWHATSGELWYLLIGALAGIITGVHMSQPRWARRE